MLEHEIEDGVLFLTPHGELTQEDFEATAEEVDAHIAEFGALRGVVVKAATFPGWVDFGAMIAHLKFVKNHHHDIKSVAFVTDDSIASHFPDFADHFVEAEVRAFAMSEEEAATDWVCAH